MFAPMRALLVSAWLLALPLVILAEGRPDPFRGVSLESMRETPSREFRPVGSTSVVYRVRLAGGSLVAFRPAQRGRPRGHLAELAAYRLARALEMENVPPVVLRHEALSRIDRLLDARFATKHRELRPKVLPRGRLVVGAAIHWVDDLTPSKLDKPEQRDRWLEALTVGGSRGDFAEPLLRDLSRLVAFDYLIGNWDRMSGGNLQTDPSGERVYVRDHNLAFDAPLLPRHEAPLLERLGRVERFSRSFVSRLRGLEGAALTRALAPDPLEPSRPILTADQLGGVNERRRAILARVDALVARHGERRVLAFE
jgi:hypothetical protein